MTINIVAHACKPRIRSQLHLPFINHSRPIIHWSDGYAATWQPPRELQRQATIDYSLHSWIHCVAPCVQPIGLRVVQLPTAIIYAYSHAFESPTIISNAIAAIRALLQGHVAYVLRCINPHLVQRPYSFSSRTQCTNATNCTCTMFYCCIWPSKVPTPTIIGYIILWVKL